MCDGSAVLHGRPVLNRSVKRGADASKGASGLLRGWSSLVIQFILRKKHPLRSLKRNAFLSLDRLLAGRTEDGGDEGAI